MNRLRQLKKSDWIAIALTGVLILIIAIPLSPKKGEETKTAEKEISETVSGNGGESQDAYVASLERK